MNCLTYPFKTMRLSQGYSDGNHKSHITGKPVEYPIDEAGVDGNRDYFYCPCDEVKIVKLYGSQSVGYHVWLESTAKVDLANGKIDYISIMAVHLNQDDYSKLKVGQTFKRGQQMFREGNSGNSSGNHIHFAVGLGKASAKSFWQQNNNSNWVLVTTNGAIKPEDAYYVDPAFTTIKDNKGLSFKKLGTANTTTKTGDGDMTRGYFQNGDKNEGVYALKQMLIGLKNMGVISQAIDDNNEFGDGTLKAVKEVQTAAKIKVDGYAGVITLKACRTLIDQAVKNRETKISNAKKALG